MAKKPWGNFKMKFVGYDLHGTLIRGAPAGYEQGKVYMKAARHANYAWWEPLELIPGTRPLGRMRGKKPVVTVAVRDVVAEMIPTAHFRKLGKSLAISVIVPFYEKGEAWEKTWKELKIQLSPSDEVVIVDDHSPSGVPDCGCDLVKVIRPKKRVPHVYRLNTLRNTGIEHAKNDCIIILDPDCIPNKDFMEHARGVFDPAVLFAGLIDFTQKNGEVQLDPRGERRNSRWVDLAEVSCGMVWGGCMMFSKSRAALVDWFDTDYDEAWGAEDHDFGSRCFHSGMRLRYEAGLSVLHQYHPQTEAKNRQDHYKRNLALWQSKIKVHAKSLNVVTLYRPIVSVNVVTMLRPYYIDQCLRSIFRTRIPLKLYLVNQGDDSAAQKQALQWWRRRWAVKYIYNKRVEPLPKIRNEILEDARRSGMKYHVILDDDATIIPGGIEALVRACEENPEYAAVAGYIVEPPMAPKMLGGYVDFEKGINYDLPRVAGRGVVDAEYLSTGFVIVRLSSLVKFDEEYEYGWDDWDWSLMMHKQGLKLGLCHDAGVYHRVLFTPKGPKKRTDPAEYRAIRYEYERAVRMNKIFVRKWGYQPTAPKLWKGVRE